jgi:hypothetical protein
MNRVDGVARSLELTSYIKQDAASLSANPILLEHGISRKFEFGFKVVTSVYICDSVTTKLSAVSVATRHRNSDSLFLIDLAFRRIIRRPTTSLLALRIATRFPGWGRVVSSTLG